MNDKTSRIIWWHLHEIPRVDKSTDKESTLVTVWGKGRGGRRKNGFLGKGFYFGGMEMCGDRIDMVVAQRCECVQTADFRFCEFYFSAFLNKEGSVGKEIMSTTTGLVHHHSVLIKYSWKLRQWQVFPLKQPCLPPPWEGFWGTNARLSVKTTPGGGLMRGPRVMTYRHHTYAF